MKNEQQNNNTKECKIVRFDWAIKNLLRNKANFDILEGFLSELLKQQIKIESLLESESNQETRDDKFNRVDILVNTEYNKKILIEVQTASEWDYYHRMLFGTSKLVTEYINTGQEFFHISKVISVSILFFNLGIGKDYIYTGTTEFKGVHTGDTLQFSKRSTDLYLNKLQRDYNSPSDIFPTYYVIQLKKFANVIKDKVDQWVYLLKNESIKPEFDAQGVSAALQKLDILKLPPEKRRRYEKDMEQKSFEASLAASHETDVRVARAEKATEIAKLLKADGLSIEQIAKYTQLSNEEIEQL